jgi:hypothetical protein
MRLVVLLLAAALAPAATLDQLLPPKPSLVFGLRASSLSGMIETQGGAKGIQAQLTGLLALTPFAGFDPFHDIDEFVVAATATGQNPPSLAVITGRFNPEKIAGGKGTPYKNALLVPNSQPSQTLAILDPNTLLAGDVKLVKAAIDRAAGNIAPTALGARIEDLRSRYDVWAFADHLDSGALPDDPLHGIDHLSFGAAFTRDFALTGELHFKNTIDMARILTMVHGLEQQLAPAKFGLTMEGNTLKIALAIPEAEWKKVLAGTAKPATPAKPAASPQVITRDSTGRTVILTLPGKQ